MRKRITALLLAICMMFSLVTIAEARASEYLEAYSILLIAKGGGRMAVDMTAVGTKSMSRIGVMEVKIEEKTTSTGTWRTFDTMYGVDDPATFYKNNSWDYLGTIYFNGTANRYYRVTITVHAVLNGVGSDTGTVTSTTILCK